MKIERLSKLLESFGSSSQSTQANTAKEANSAAEDAVKVGSGFGKAASIEEGSSDRTRRIAEIKAQVTSGTYKPESGQIAQAVARDLLA